ncbi:homeobox protein HAT3.1 [Euphorbia lathyris]|uniref:homeobox protein HAT3.1 n=1 Tax=Euphorbia lathyris TaxID=212925 RepID=UPI003313757A
MFKAELMGTSPSQASCSGSYSCQKQSTPEEPLECGTGTACKSTKPNDAETIQSGPDDSECKQGASEALQPCSLTENLDPPPEDTSKSTCQKQSTPEEPLECGTGTACKSTKPNDAETIQSGPDDSECKQGASEALQPCSLTENLDPPPEDTSKSTCQKQSTPEEPLECGTGTACKSTKPNDAETIQSGPDDSECKQGASEALQPCSLTENLDPPPEDTSKSSLLNSSLRPEPNSKDQKLEFVSENTNTQPCVGSENVSPSKGKNSLDSGIVQNGIALETVNETLQPFPEGATENSAIIQNGIALETVNETLQPFPEGATEKSGAFSEQSEEQPKSGQELVHNESAKTSTAIYSSLATGHLEEPHVLAGKSYPVKQLGLPPDSEINEILEPDTHDIYKHRNLNQSESPSKDAADNAGRLASRVKRTTKSPKRKYILRSLISTDRVLRSRSQEKPKAPESSANVVNVNSTEKTRKKKKNKQQKRIEVDEYSRIKARLRYLLSKICYEQSLITAYSSDGWKGLSLEKIKPEQELQRATSAILRRKLEIRNLFQRIDSLCAEGRFSESLFDSEGLISSEDIFCAKCGSKDLAANNDIILCDGVCDRGFHQFCLVPPLLNEDIPPDDEGWLCPGCDCRVDSIHLLNESQGTKVSFNDSWKKVFPEAAATGQNPDQNQGLSSDDSDDNDFDPDRPEIDEESQGDESSSNDSDFTSDELEAAPGNKQHLGISSDDSEDDDYNPDAPQPDDNVKEGSSSSDFTSDSDDLTVFDTYKVSGEVESCKSILQGDSVRENSCSGRKNQSLGSELLSTSEPSAAQDTSLPISAKRTVERLDYKKLYDETYGNVSSDTSNDEDYFDALGPLDNTKAASGSANGKISARKIANRAQKDSKYIPKRSRRKSNSENASGVSFEVHEGSLPSSSSGKRVKKVHKRLGEAATQGLYKLFKENQYPNRAAKESLAKELGITFQQVNKWFDNARWSFNHPSPMDARSVRKKAEKGSAVPKSSNNKSLEPEHDETVGKGATSNGGAQSEEAPKAVVSPMETHDVDAKDADPGSQEITIPQSKTTPRPRKRKHSSEDQPDAPESTMMETEKLPATDLSNEKGEKAQASRRVTRRKSIG